MPTLYILIILASGTLLAQTQKAPAKPAAATAQTIDSTGRMTRAPQQQGVVKPDAVAPRAQQAASEPIAVFRRDPGYTFEALAAEFEGSEQVKFTVDEQGKPQNIATFHALPFGLDDRCMSMVRAWRFKPGAAKATVRTEFSFRLPNGAGHGSAEGAAGMHAAAVGLLNAGSASAADAYAMYNKAAEKGYVPSQVSLCLLYLDGWQTPRDFETGRQWCAKAADQGSAAGQQALGDIYNFGKGVATDFGAAAGWYAKAAAQGYAPAQTALGKAYAAGKGVPKDPAAALTWFERAAEQGAAEAQYELARLFEQGVGTKVNLPQAYFWTLVAARQGYLNAIASVDRLKALVQPAAAAAPERDAEVWRPKQRQATR